MVEVKSGAPCSMCAFFLSLSLFLFNLYSISSVVVMVSRLTIRNDVPNMDNL